MSELDEFVASVQSIGSECVQVTSLLHAVAQRIRQSAARVDVIGARDSRSSRLPSVAASLYAAAAAAVVAGQAVADVDAELRQYLSAVREASGAVAIGHVALVAISRQGSPLPPSQVRYARYARLAAIPVRGHKSLPVLDAELLAGLAIHPIQVLDHIGSVTYQPQRPRPEARGVSRVSKDGRKPIDIELYQQGGDDAGFQLLEALNHEVGHVVWFRLLDDTERAAWGALHEQALRDGEDFVTPYSRGTAVEDFAECYGAFTFDPARLRDISPKRYLFIDRYVSGLRDHETALGD